MRIVTHFISPGASASRIEQKSHNKTLKMYFLVTSDNQKQEASAAIILSQTITIKYFKEFKTGINFWAGPYDIFLDIFIADHLL